MIPISTTLITVLRTPANADRDPLDTAPADEIVAENVRAQISSPTGRERNAGGVQSIVEFSLSCDPVDLTYKDRVLDQTTGETYEVSWVKQRTGFNLDHTRAGLKYVQGVTA